MKKDFTYFRMKSIDILSFYQNKSEGSGTVEVFELVRVQKTPCWSKGLFASPEALFNNSG
jgi:hypothetical protein